MVSSSRGAAHKGYPRHGLAIDQPGVRPFGLLRVVAYRRLGSAGGPCTPRNRQTRSEEGAGRLTARLVSEQASGWSQDGVSHDHGIQRCAVCPAVEPTLRVESELSLPPADRCPSASELDGATQARGLAPLRLSP